MISSLKRRDILPVPSIPYLCSILESNHSIWEITLETSLKFSPLTSKRSTGY